MKKIFCNTILFFVSTIFTFNIFAQDTAPVKDSFYRSLLKEINTVPSSEQKTVRIGFENVSGFIEKTSNGLYEGYGIEYLNEVCKYVNWNIEYVEASFDEQIRLLQEGQIDFIPFAQYSSDRADLYEFSRQPMGVVQGILSVLDDNIYYEDFKTFNGKKIGITKGNRNKDFLEQYSHIHGFSYELVEYNYHYEVVDALQNGEVDIIATEQSIGCDEAHIVGHFGSDPAYFISKKNSVLMQEMNYAINEIYSHKGTFRTTLYQKYFGNKVINTKPTFTREEVEFIKNHEPYSVMVVPDSKPRAYADKTGNITGLIPDYFKLITEISGIQFNFHFGKSDETPLQHLQENPNVLLGGVCTTNPAFQTTEVIVSNTFHYEDTAILTNAKSYEDIDLNNGNHTIGVTPMFQALHLFLKSDYPNLQIDSSRSTVSKNLQALNDNEIPLFAYNLNVILHYWGNPRYQNIRILTNTFYEEPMSIVTTNTEEHRMLMKIINKCIAIIPKEKVNDIETYHVMQSYYQATLSDTMYNLRLPILLIVVLILSVMFFLSSNIEHRKENEALMAEKNEELAIAVKKAESASRAKSDFLSLMSHDIRTPMNAIMGMTKLAQNEKSKNKKITEYLSKIEESSNILLRLLNDILDKSAIEKGKLKINHAPFDLKNELTHICDIYIPQFFNKNIEFITDFSSIKTTALIGDAMRINQIILNLISNAYKFTPENGKIIFKVTESDFSKDKVQFTFTVEDTGIGMSEEMLSRLFLPFEQKDATIAHRHGGSGLGLNITKSLTELMNGTIDVKSTPNVGTNFIVTLPFDIQGEEKQSQESGNNKTIDELKAQYNFKKKCILIADDDSFNREVVSGLLEIIGAKCVCVEDGKKVVEKFIASEEGYYDAILIDIHMPVLNGYDATKAIRDSNHKDAKRIPIFALTADSFDDAINRAKECGMSGHIGKPIYQEKLYNALQIAFTSTIQNTSGGGEFYN